MQTFLIYLPFVIFVLGLGIYLMSKRNSDLDKMTANSRTNTMRKLLGIPKAKTESIKLASIEQPKKKESRKERRRNKR